MDRSIGVTIIAVLSLLGSIILLYYGMSAVGALARFPLPVSDPRTAHFMQVLLWSFTLASILLGIWGIVRSIGLLGLKNWARWSVLVFSVLLVLVSGLFSVSGLIRLLSNHAGLSVPGWQVALYSFPLIGIGVWWLALLTCHGVKAQLRPLSQLSSLEVPQHSLAHKSSYQSLPQAASPHICRVVLTRAIVSVFYRGHSW